MTKIQICSIFGDQKNHSLSQALEKGDPGHFCVFLLNAVRLFRAFTTDFFGFTGRKFLNQIAIEDVVLDFANTAENFLVAKRNTILAGEDTVPIVEDIESVGLLTIVEDTTAAIEGIAVAKENTIPAGKDTVHVEEDIESVGRLTIVEDIKAAIKSSVVIGSVNIAVMVGNFVIER